MHTLTVEAHARGDIARADAPARASWCAHPAAPNPSPSLSPSFHPAVPAYTRVYIYIALAYVHTFLHARTYEHRWLLPVECHALTDYFWPLYTLYVYTHTSSGRLFTCARSISSMPVFYSLSSASSLPRLHLSSCQPLKGSRELMIFLAE